MRRAKLREAREAADRTQEQVAYDIDVDRTTVGKWERGESTPTPGQRSKYASAIGVTLQELHAMLSSMPPDDDTPDWLASYLGMEQSATRMDAHEPRAVYGLFQTPAYADGIVRTVGIDGAPEDYIARSVELREHRQRRVHSGEVELSVVQTEGSLRLRAGDNETMAEQLDHLADMATTLPNVTIRVAPFDLGQYEAYRLGDFVIMRHPWGGPRVHLENYSGGRFITNADEVSYFQEAYGQARTLSTSDSIEFFRTQAHTWRQKL